MSSPLSSPPSRVGPYRIGGELGRGSSGIVYEATDEKLGRKVALKVLADEVAASPEQRARFVREARLLAAVQHPHVAVVYGVVEEGERVWLALEYLEGSALSDELARGPLPMSEALDIARQIADGLEAAHESGVVHRDLKPANVQRATDSNVKVLDFGLAKPVREGVGDSAELSSDGLVLGTPLYMSPEQLRGRSVDRRADVWAFGCVLWELLTGRRPFEGDSLADVVNAILEHDPDTAQLPENTPVRVRELLARLLQKDPRRRLRDVGDARLELETALEERAWVGGDSRGADTAEVPSRRPSWLVVVGVALVAALLGSLSRRDPADGGAVGPSPLRLVLDVPPGDKQTYPRVAPDGSFLVHEIAVTRLSEGRHLVKRAFDSFEDVPIPGTERVDTYAVSHDSERIALVRVQAGDATRYELSLVRIDGAEPPEFVMTLPEDLNDDGALAWLDSGPIVLSRRPRSLFVVEPDGTSRDVPVLCDESTWPHAPDILEAVPGSDHVLAANFRLDERGAAFCIVAIHVVTGEMTILVEDSRFARVLSSGHLLFTRADVLFGVSLDLETLSAGSDPVRIADEVRTSSAWTSGTFHASRNGVVAWRPGGVFGAENQIHWIDGDGVGAPWSDQKLAIEGYMNVDTSGGFLTALVTGAAGTYELWGSEVDAPRLRPLQREAGYDYFGGYASLADRRLYFCRFSPRSAELRRTSLDKPDAGELLYRIEESGVVLSSPVLLNDGRTLSAGLVTPDTLHLIHLDVSAEPPLEPHVVIETPRETRHLLSSFDGRFVLVTSKDGAVQLHPVEEHVALAPVPVPTAGIEAIGAWWNFPEEKGPYRIHVMPTDARSVYEIEMDVGPEGPTFSAPQLLFQLQEASVFDCAVAGTDRYLGIPMEERDDRFDRVHVLIDGLGELLDEGR